MTEGTVGDQIVAEYLDQLRAAADVLPAARREELVAEVGVHLQDARREALRDDDGTVRTLLDRLGPPQEIVAAAVAEDRTATTPPVGSRRLPGRDQAATLLLPLGGFLFLVGWFAGVILLWTSEHWTTRQKVIGTLVFPFGSASALILGTLPGRSTVCGSGGVIDAETGRNVSTEVVCSSQGFSLPGWLGAVVFVVLVFAPIAVSIWLSSRAHAYRRPVPS